VEPAWTTSTSSSPTFSRALPSTARCSSRLATRARARSWANATNVSWISQARGWSRLAYEQRTRRAAVTATASVSTTWRSRRRHVTSSTSACAGLAARRRDRERPEGVRLLPPPLRRLFLRPRRHQARDRPHPLAPAGSEATTTEASRGPGGSAGIAAAPVSCRSGRPHGDVPIRGIMGTLGLCPRGLGCVV
jgi:hypothetical protein